jgi:hypothetical protein
MVMTRGLKVNEFGTILSNRYGLNGAFTRLIAELQRERGSIELRVRSELLHQRAGAPGVLCILYAYEFWRRATRAALEVFEVKF